MKLTARVTCISMTPRHVVMQGTYPAAEKLEANRRVT